MQHENPTGDSKYILFSNAHMYAVYLDFLSKLPRHLNQSQLSYVSETRVGFRGYGLILGKFPTAVETKLPRRAKPKARAEAGYQLCDRASNPVTMQSNFKRREKRIRFKGLEGMRFSREILSKDSSQVPADVCRSAGQKLTSHVGQVLMSIFEFLYRVPSRNQI